jgi:hypothetical protein
MLTAAFLLTGCLDNLESPALPPAAFVSIYQGAPAAPAMDVFANQNRVNPNPLNYSDVLAYSAFYPGTRGFRFSGLNSATSLLEKNFVLKADSVYSIFVTDKAQGIDALIVKDQWAEPKADKAQLRLVHLSPDTEKVFLEIPGISAPQAVDLTFGSASTFVEVPIGNMALTVKSGLTSGILVKTGTLELKGNRVYTLILKGRKNETLAEKKLDLQLITNFINF